MANLQDAVKPVVEIRNSNRQYRSRLAVRSSFRRLRASFALSCVPTALAHLLLALSASVWLYVLAFTMASFRNASMMPALAVMVAIAVREPAGEK